MSRNKKINKFLKNYFAKTNRKETLKVFLEELESGKKDNSSSNMIKLSFAIQKPPDRKRIDIEAPKKKDKISKEKKLEGSQYRYSRRKLSIVPADFGVMATKFGLPKEHLEFFYEHRESFHWEIKGDQQLYCTGNNLHCKFTTKVKPKALVQHMIDSHGFGDFPCGKKDCEYVAYSEKTLRYHTVKFHGIGKRAASVDQLHRCKFSSCPYISPTTSALELHHRIHENRLLICEFCNVKTAKDTRMTIHLMSHFNIKPFVCEVCSYPFSSNAELSKHTRFSHSNDFTCCHCLVSLTSIASYQKHVRTCEKRLMKFAY